MQTRFYFLLLLSISFILQATGQTRYSRTYHNNGNIKLEGNLVNGEPDGIWRQWSQDSLLVTSTVYKDGVIQSETKFNSRGQITRTIDGTLHSDYGLELSYENGYVTNRRWIDIRNNKFGSYGSRYSKYGSTLQLKDSAELSYWSYQLNLDKIGRNRTVLPRISFYEGNRLKEVSYDGISIFFDQEGRINRYTGPLDESLETYSCSFQTYDGKVLVRKKNKPVDIEIKTSNFVGIVSIDVENGLPKGTWSAKYPNGKTWFKMSFKDGFVQGKYEAYYANGKPRANTSFDRDHVDGDYYEGYQDGKPMIQGECAKGNMVGDWKLLSDAGIEITSFTIYKDSYDGWYIRKRQDGNFISKSFYNKGVIDGASFEYASSGWLEQSRYYAKGKLLKTTRYNSKGEVTYLKEEESFTYGYHANGMVESMWYRDDVNGMSMTLDTNGKPNRFHYHSGKMYNLFGQYNSDTLYRYSYEIGGEQIDLKPFKFIKSWPKKYVECKGSYQGTDRTGEWVVYHPTGEVWAKGEYKDGLLNGLWQYYNLDGKKVAEKSFKLGVLHGVHRVWDFYGKQKLEATYHDGEYDGIYKKWFDDKDQIANIHHYMHGKPEGTQTRYNQEGILLTEATYVDGLQTGVYKTYNAKSGKLETESYYANNKRSGLYKQYDKSGNVLTEINYLDGLKHGLTIRYDGAGNVLKSERYDYGELVEEKSNIPCECESGDASLVRARYFPSVKDLAEWDEVLFFMDGKLQIPKHTYERTFYSQLQPVGGLGGRNRFDIINRNEFAFQYIESPGLDFVVNPCIKQNEFSKISFMAAMDYPIKRLADKDYDPVTFRKKPRDYFDVAMMLNNLSVRDILFSFRRYFGYDVVEVNKGMKRALEAYKLALEYDWEEQRFEELIALLASNKSELIEAVYHECFDVPTLDFDNFPTDYKKYNYSFQVFFGNKSQASSIREIDNLFEKSLHVEFGNKQLGIDFPEELFTPITPVVKTLGAQTDVAKVRLLMNVVAFSYKSTDGIKVDRASSFCFTPCYLNGTSLSLEFDSARIYFGSDRYQRLRVNDTLSRLGVQNGIYLQPNIQVASGIGQWTSETITESVKVIYTDVYLSGEYVIGTVLVNKNEGWSDDVQREFLSTFDDMTILDNGSEHLRVLFLFKSKF